MFRINSSSGPYTRQTARKCNGISTSLHSLRFLNRASWYTYVRWTNKMHTLFINEYNWIESLMKKVCFSLLLLTFIHLVVCLTTGPKPLPKRALHTVRPRASSFKWQYPLLSLTLILLTWRIWWAPNNASKCQMGFNSAFKGLRSSSSFLRLLTRLPVTSSPPFIFPSITRYRSQFLRKMWAIQFAFRLRISCRIFLCSLILSNTSSFPI